MNRMDPGTLFFKYINLNVAKFAKTVIQQVSASFQIFIKFPVSIITWLIWLLVRLKILKYGIPAWIEDNVQSLSLWMLSIE